MRLNPFSTSMLRGYAPLVVLAGLFVLSAGVLPSVDQPEAAGEFAGGFSDDGYGGDVVVDEGDAGGGDGGSSGGGVTSGGSGGTVTPGQPQSEVPSGAGGDPVSNPGRGLGSCAGREDQVPGDPYSPPCIEFAGINGGNTSMGVTKDKITIAFRVVNEKGFQQTLAELAGAEIVDEPSDVKRTTKVLEQYFNERFQFYGRKLEIVFHNAAGSTLTELQGGGRAEAEADADRVAKELKAFAEMAGSTEPYIDALTRRKVIGMGTPYLSREWHLQRRPFAWSIATDCSIVAEVAAELSNKMLFGRPAKWAGGNLANKPRKFAGLSPENPWYQECHSAAERIVEKAGNDPGKKINYKLDLASMSNQAANVVAQLKQFGATTILCGCDPIFPVFLTAKAAEQGYKPEWIHLGTALIDIDVVGQLYDQDQWSRAFGVSALGKPIPVRAGLGYAAYKTMRDDEPAFAVDIIYGQMYMVAIGVQMAGPNLNPLTFEKGMRAYPGGTGRFGTWGFPDQAYTPTRDYRMTWWNPDCLSIENNKHGAYVEAFGGERFPLNNLPSLPKSKQPPVFTGECP